MNKEGNFRAAGSYFILDQSLRKIKIGASNDICYRYWTLRRKTGGTLYLVGAQLSRPKTVYESALHKQFLHLRYYGEYFDLAEDLVEYIDSLPVPEAVQGFVGYRPLVPLIAENGWWVRGRDEY